MDKFKESDKHKGIMLFYCPGCKEIHSIVTCKQDYPSPVWEFNGDMEKPTVSPSIKVTWRHPKGYDNKHPAPIGWNGKYVEEICHSFVKGGKIQFLSDCTHKLAGKTVDMVEWRNVDPNK